MRERTCESKVLSLWIADLDLCSDEFLDRLDNLSHLTPGQFRIDGQCQGFVFHDMGEVPDLRSGSW